MGTGTRRARAIWVAITMVIAVAAASCTGPPDPPIVGPAPSPTAGSVPAFTHVVVIVLENENYANVFGSAAATHAPYLNSLATDWSIATRYYGVGHASLDNYIALTSGQAPKAGTEEDCPFSDCGYAASVPTIADQVEASGRTWKAYLDGMSRPCQHGLAGSLDPYTFYLPPLNTYATRHNPFMYYRGITGNPSRCAAHDVPYPQLSTDLANRSLPDYSFISPDLCHDGHESRCGIRAADAWLSTNLPPLIASPEIQHGGVVFVTFDEADADNSGCCGSTSGGGRVGTIVISPTYGKRGISSSVPENHYSLLRTIEDAWHLPLLGHAHDAAISPMTEYFTSP